VYRRSGESLWSPGRAAGVQSLQRRSWMRMVGCVKDLGQFLGLLIKQRLLPGGGR
jgi:hypothetical protein